MTDPSPPDANGGRSRRAYRVAYDGRPFHGFQRQPDVPTVEDALFDALRALDVLGADEPRPPGYAAAGRTDAGVSARSQTVALDAPPWLSPAALNAHLPESVRAWASADAPPEFHATHDARAREYAYHLYAPREGGRASGEGNDRDDDGVAGLGAARTVDDERAGRALERLRGEHDFHTLTPDDEGTVRDLDAALDREGPWLVLRFRAGGFARQLVRRLVGLVTEVASGEAGLDRIERVLGPDPLDGPAGVAPAPARPLILWTVEYGPDLEFAVDEQAAESARAAFGRRHRERLVGARVARTIGDGVK